MPTYEYACRTCGARFEAWQKITDDPIETCPTCGNPVHRVLYPVGLVFKGSGFYKTDSRGSTTAVEPAGEPASATHSASEESSSGTAAKDGAAPSGSASEAKSKPAAEKPTTDKPVAAASGE